MPINALLFPFWFPTSATSRDLYQRYFSQLLGVCPGSYRYNQVRTSKVHVHIGTHTVEYHIGTRDFDISRVSYRKARYSTTGINPNSDPVASHRSLKFSSPTCTHCPLQQNISCFECLGMDRIPRTGGHIRTGVSPLPWGTIAGIRLLGNCVMHAPPRTPVVNVTCGFCREDTVEGLGHIRGICGRFFCFVAGGP